MSWPAFLRRRRQNLDSLNLDAELLTKLLGATLFGPPGSIAKGARAIQQWARRHGADVVAHDGSGLSYTNSVSTNGIVRLLSAANHQPWGPALRSTLTTAGEGTLSGRLISLRVRAKTGTLLHQVSALSGWIWLQRQRPGPSSRSSRADSRNLRPSPSKTESSRSSPSRNEWR